MKPNQRLLLLHPLFLFSLVILFLNDLYWKTAYPGWVTGKLSDFSGMIVLPLFLIAVFNGRRMPFFVLSALFFIWWKSSFSEPVLNLAGSISGYTIGRTVDYSDLIVLLVLPFIYHTRTPEPRLLPITSKISVPLIGLLSFITLCSTSLPRYMQGSDQLYLGITLRKNLPDEKIVEKLRSKYIAVYPDTADYRELFRDNLYFQVEDSMGEKRIIKARDYPEDIKVLQRREQYYPSYIIPVLIAGKDTIRDLRFQVIKTREKTKTRVQLVSVSYPSPEPDNNLNTRKKYSTYINKVLRQKFKELLR